jgi:hypothetical protein
MSYIRLAVAMLFIVALAAGTACSSGSTANTASGPRQASSPTPTAAAKLDPAVSPPSGFPADVPLYPGARLTAAASFSGTGQTTWGMNWETADSVAKVQAFYSSKLSQGDWNIAFTANTAGYFSATFNRKSNSKFGGILSADGSSGLTRISMSLATAA